MAMQDRSNDFGEFDAEVTNGQVGSILLSESVQSRVWYILLKPGEKLPYHRHVCNYFWLSLAEGRGRSHIIGKGIVETSYHPGQTRHFAFGPGEYMVHDLENCGDSDLIFVTVESLNGDNAPLPLPDCVAPTDRILSSACK
jgi:hypothetical protein